MRTGNGLFKAAHLIGMANANARKHGELAAAAGHVIAKRLSLGAQALGDPFNADHAEFAKMVPEKAEAFSKANLAMLRSSTTVGGKLAGYAMADMTSATKAMLSLVDCKTLASVVQVQTGFWTSWMLRSFSRSIEIGSLAARSQGAAMAPIHRAATGNSRRLAR